MIGATVCAAPALAADVTYDRLLKSAAEPQNWLMVNGDYSNHRYSSLSQINTANVKNLKLAFTVALGGNEPGGDNPRAAMEGSPLVDDGFMYVSDGWNQVYKIDLRSGDDGVILWKTDPGIDKASIPVPASRGLSLYKDLVVTVTGDGHVLGLKTGNGRIVQDELVKMAPTEGYTGAPLVIKDKLIFGVSGGDYRGRPWLGALDLESWKLAWRRYIVPAPGEPGSETWADDHNAWKTGGGGVWATGAFDPATNRTYWGTGNPAPMLDSAARPGDNLYSESSLALDPDTGAMDWYYQYTPNDPFDYDETGGQVLATVAIDGKPRKILSHFGRNGMYYDLDLANGQFIKGGQYVTRLTWTKGLDPKTGKPLEYDPSKLIQTYNSEVQPQRGGPMKSVCPDTHGGSDYWPPAFSPLSNLTYAGSWEGCGESQVIPDKMPNGGTHTNHDRITGALTAVDPVTAKVTARYLHDAPNMSGATATAGHLVFTAFLDGTVVALDDRTLKPLYTFHTGNYIGAPPVVYAVNGKEYVAILGGGPLSPHLQGPYANRDIMKIEASSVLYVFAL